MNMNWLKKSLSFAEKTVLPLAAAFGVPLAAPIGALLNHTKASIGEAQAVAGASNEAKLAHVENSVQEGLDASNAMLGMMHPPKKMVGDDVLRRAMIEDSLNAVKADMKAAASAKAFAESFKIVDA